MKHVVPLEAVSATELPLAGGKAAGLVKLLRMGLDVPRGVVLLTTAFDRFLKATGLHARRLELFEAFRTTSNEEELAQRCEELRLAAMEAPVPPDIETELLAGTTHLVPPLAVRSSATAEDSKRTAFAGVFHSELHVVRERLMDAVRTCWSHAFSHQAITHALRCNLDPSDVHIALVVQEMIAADRSGVLFTREPSGAHPELVLVSMTSGEGASLMHGDVSGHSISLPRKGKAPANPLFKKLRRLSLRIEKELGHPQDVEWCEKKGKLFFLQARPVTTVEVTGRAPILWTRELAEERFPKPISPLGWSALQGVLKVNMKTLAQRFGLIARRPEDIARTIRHYVYSNEKFFSIPGSLRPNPLVHLRFLGTYLRELLGFFRHLPVALVSKPLGVAWLLLSRAIRGIIFPHAREIRRDWDAHLEGLIEEIDRFNEVDPRALATKDLFRHRLDMEEVAQRYMEPDLAIYVVKMASSWAVEKIGQKVRGRNDPAFLADLTSGLANNITLRMNAELEELSDCFARDPGLTKLLLGEDYDRVLSSMQGEQREAFERFVTRNGHTTTNWDLREPTWGEEPRHVLRMLRSYSLAPRRRSFRQVIEERLERYRKARAEVLTSLRGSSWSLPFFEELLDTLHEFMRIDEEHHFYASRLYKPMRRLYAEFGKRLLDLRIIEKPEDVYFLELREIEEALLHGPPFSRRYLVEARRGSFLRSEAARPPHRYVDQAPLPEPELPQGLGNVLKGVGASPGIATGIVRVIESPDQVSEFRAGEVLVTVSPNPAWTPVYAVASALVTSTGSILSHGLVSAREYHLPAVIGIADVTRRLTTGQEVTVDGHQGTVSF
ncbi:MAG: hypothetical protein HY698_00180 [Deltaproteobacteria bacterium]|nr:hypothetical protein [Deltaproteobacteria bacterium]